MFNSRTKLIGLLGYPLEHSFSPLMHNLTLQRMGLNYVYLPLEIKPDVLNKAVDAIRIFNMVGVNVTIPYKEKVINYLDDLSADAKACGAVNLIKNENGKLVGYNTDGKGFVAGLKEAGIQINGHILLIGAGGAARAVAYALAAENAETVTFLDCDIYKAQSLADFISKKTGIASYAGKMSREIFKDIASKSDIIINCTPVGMYPKIDESPVDNIDMLKKQAVLCDLIYNPKQTKLLSMGKAKNLPVINGLPMFVHQGALTLKILSGEDPPINYMKEVVFNQIQ